VAAAKLFMTNPQSRLSKNIIYGILLAKTVA
jgi:hypothetical protein